MDLSTLFKEDKVGERLVYHVYEIHAWGEKAELDIRLKLVCKDFRKFAIQYNRTPRYAVAEYWDGIDDMLKDFKEGHIAKMLRELDLTMYWDMFDRPRVHAHFEQYALDPDLFNVLTTMGVKSGDHLDKMMMRFRSSVGAKNAKTVRNQRIAAENDSVWRENVAEVAVHMARIAAENEDKKIRANWEAHLTSQQPFRGEQEMKESEALEKNYRDEEQKEKEDMRVILCKYDLEEDLDKLSRVSVFRLDDIAFMYEEDCLNLKGDLAKYQSVFAQESQANAVTDKAAKKRRVGGFADKNDEARLEKESRDEKQEQKEALRVVLCKYDLEEDLDNLWNMGVWVLDDIVHLDEADCLNLKGNLAKYQSVLAQENQANANAEYRQRSGLAHWLA